MRSTSALSPAARSARVVWVSFAYGFGTDMAYYGPLFAEFKRRMPQTRVPVEHDYPVELYPDLPLVPVLHFWRKHVKRAAGAGVYEGDLPLPKASVPLALASISADVYVLIEFSAVAILGLLAAKMKRKKVVLLIESHPRYRGSTPGGVTAERVKGWLARRADVVLAGNDSAREFAVDRLGVNANCLVVGPYLTSQPQPTAEDRAARFLGDDRVHFLFLNSINPRKGIEQLIHAMGRLDESERARCVLDVVGAGPQLEAVTTLVSELGLQSCVRFHGKVSYNEIGAAYAACDVVVCPTLADYRSLAGIEAVNAGKPVLISIYDGAHEELVAATSSVIPVDPVDIEGFSEQLRALIVNDDHRNNLIRHARNFVPERFAISAAGANVQRAVEMAIGADVADMALQTSEVQ